jgi:hypothetical protein
MITSCARQMAASFDPPGQIDDDPEPDLPGRLGSYLRKERIARGGFGVVYRAEHAEHGAPAALKVVHAELASSPVMVARFEREIDAVRRIDHPGVVRVLEQGRLPDGRPFFAMELLAGEDLGVHLKARGRLPPAEVLEIFEPLCAVVAEAHTRAIIHRDIKASNVMLAREGDRRRVVLLDFGVAKLLDDEGPKLTSSRHLVGTLSCMAPEQILSKPVGERTDVYALGILAYRLLTGEAPFSARSFLAMQQMHLGAVPRTPSALVPLQPAADTALLRALAKEPGARQPGAIAFFEELRAALTSAEAIRPAERRVLAVLVELRVPPEALDAPSDALLADMEAILPRAATELESVGLKVAMETGTTLLLAVERPVDIRADLRLRRGVLVAVLSLYDRLQARSEAHPDVDIRFCAHAGLLALDPGGAAAGGPLLQLDAWVPEGETPGFIASRAAVEGLALRSLPLTSMGGEWVALSG